MDANPAFDDLMLCETPLLPSDAPNERTVEKTCPGFLISVNEVGMSVSARDCQSLKNGRFFEAEDR